jgi:polysaccharide biosynthesis PFTS motif protein
MAKSIVFCSEPKFLRLFKSFIVYIRSSFRDGEGQDKKNIVIVQDDIFTAKDLSDYQSSSVESQLIERIIKKKQVQFLLNWGGKDYLNFFIGRQVLKDIDSVYESINYVKLVCLKYGISGTVYFFPLNFSLKIYKEMGKMNLLPKQIKIHFIAKIYLYLYSTLKYFYFIFRMLLYPEIIFFRMSKTEFIENDSFDSIAYLDDGLIMPSSDSIESDNRILKLFGKHKVLFVDDRYEKSQLWPKILRDLGKKVLRLEDIVRHISRKKYLTNYYYNASRWRFKLVLLSLQQPWLSPSCSRAVRLRILWDLFYSKYSSKKAIRMMVEENLTSFIVHKKNNVKTLFIYFSTTEDTKPKREEGIATNHDYIHMMSDIMVSSIVSNDFFKKSSNKIGKYITLGPIFSDLVYESKLKRDFNRNKLNVRVNQKIVTFFDHTIGYKKVLTFKAYENFLKGFIKLSRDNKRHIFIFKSKKTLPVLEGETNQVIVQLISQIREMSNCIYANELDLIPMELIGISDLVVSAPMSSVIFESLCGDVRCISYDPLGQYEGHEILSQNIPNLNANSYVELEKLVNYWLYHCDDANFDIFLHTYVRPFIDPACNKHTMIDRFHKVLLT